MAGVLLLPGSVLPAALAYGPLMAELDDVEAVAKDLELYAGGEPPPDYSLELESSRLLREADARGWDRFHLAGYSGGGAAAIAFAASHGERLLSLALLEPAWAGNRDQLPEERSWWQAFRQAEELPGDRFMSAFVRLEVAAGVEPPPPPPGDPPPFMASRPAGIRALTRAFRARDLEPEALARFGRPVYFALGGLSNPAHYRAIATRLAGTFPDFELEIFEERHHFDPPHRIEPERLARSLRRLWERAERAEGVSPGGAA